MRKLLILLAYLCYFPFLSGAQHADSIPNQTVEFVNLNSITIKCKTLEKVIDSALTLTQQHPNSNRVLSYSMFTLKNNNSCIVISIHSEHFDFKNIACLGVIQLSGKNIFCSGESLLNLLNIDSTQQLKIPYFNYKNDEERLFDAMLLDERHHIKQDIVCTDQTWKVVVEFLQK